MEQIPLFPLNTVLFPGWPMPLHIFEPRYLEMIQRCVSEDIPFGVVLLQEGKAEMQKNVKPYRVGCTARIRQVQNLEDGRLLIMTVGERRFRIHALHQDRAYYEASVEYLDFIDEAEEAAQEAADNLYPVFANFLDVLSDMDDSVQINSSNIPLNRAHSPSRRRRCCKAQ
jgi:Lon protease-like protein